MDRPADRIKKVVALAQSSNPHEAEVARAKALDLLGEMDLELLATLEGQRACLIEDLTIENRRLISSKERANKRTTGDLVNRAMMLLHHYERFDALTSIVALLQEKPPPGPVTFSSWYTSRYPEHEKWSRREHR